MNGKKILITNFPVVQAVGSAYKQARHFCLLQQREKYSGTEEEELLRS